MSCPANQCSVGDCERPVHKYAVSSGLCRAHYTRRYRGKTVSGPLRHYGNPARTFAEAMFAFADAADGDGEAYLRAWKRACTAGRRYLATK